VVADSKRIYLIGYARIYGLVPTATPGTVTAAELRRIGHAGIRVRRYASRKAASTHGGVQVCNVVLNKHGANATRFWGTVRKIQKACRG
jgi:hypothetical protein